MEFLPALHPVVKTWLVIPMLIMMARIVDVSLGTIRVVFLAKGMKLLAPILGFFEVLIWLVAISQIMQNLTHWINYVAYAAGFGLGNWVGLMIEAKIALGTVILRIITQKDASTLIEELRHRNLGVTSLPAEGGHGRVMLLFMVLARQQLPRVIECIQRHNPRAFFSIEDVRYVREGIFPAKSRAVSFANIRHRLSLRRKRK